MPIRDDRRRGISEAKFDEPTDRRPRSERIDALDVVRDTRGDGELGAGDVFAAETGGGAKAPPVVLNGYADIKWGLGESWGGRGWWRWG